MIEWCATQEQKGSLRSYGDGSGSSKEEKPSAGSSEPALTAKGGELSLSYLKWPTCHPAVSRSERKRSIRLELTVSGRSWSKEVEGLRSGGG